MTVLPHEQLQDLARARVGLATAGMVALLTWETVAPFFASLPTASRVQHAGRNLTLGILNAVVVGAGLAWLWRLTAECAEREHFGLLHWTGWAGPGRLLGAVLLLDAWMYAWHRLNHQIPWLWRFHRTHHSDANMDVTTASRFHGGEILLAALLRLPVIFLGGLRLEELLVYEIAMQLVVQLQHANIALPRGCETWLRWLIVTPNMHKVHHSRIPVETDSNYSSLFSIWDRLLGSYRLRPDLENIQFGLAGFDGLERQSLSGLLKTPWGGHGAGPGLPANPPSPPGR